MTDSAFFTEPLAQRDPEIFDAIRKELGRQRDEIEPPIHGLKEDGGCGPPDLQRSRQEGGRNVGVQRDARHLHVQSVFLENPLIHGDHRRSAIGG